MYKILLSKQAKKSLRKADKTLAKRLRDKLKKLQDEPVMHDTKTLEGSDKFYRVRVGDHRILYDVNHKNKTVGIISIDKRPRAYK